jgi:CheY-like chemotaxis protein
MNRHFKILWFEDEVSWYNMEQRLVSNVISDYDLIPLFTRKHGNDIDINEICSNHYDLIIMDFQLTDVTGEAIVSLIRENNVLTDTLFYSSEKSKMLNAIQKIDPPIDGIYYTDRNNRIFTEKVSGIIQKIIMRSEDLVNLRGFVLDDCCDFELRIKVLLDIAWKKFNDEEKKVLEDAICKNLHRSKERHEKQLNKIFQETPVFLSALNDKYLLTHSDRLYLTTKVIAILQKSYGFVPKEMHMNFKANYESNISSYRNALGHRKLYEDSIMLNGESIPIDSQLHKKMRKALSDYDNLIDELEKFITESI